MILRMMRIMITKVTVQNNNGDCTRTDNSNNEENKEDKDFNTGKQNKITMNSRTENEGRFPFKNIVSNLM